ncbi:vomeronasal type-1 receptor 4-like [Choloepus didactylus]|uniref:vomeronasal type-1 receptor 4-like n=1 Tax=Choloepus didactylus TaxID=27675 RepID=UPI00189F0E1E|nr:vomeronasal type-1 receptor 4-like [Choloepus didactylus]
MLKWDLVIGLVFSSQTIVGVLGNFSLLYHYLFLCFSGCRLRNTDLILQHLIVANSLILFSKGVPQTMATLGWKQFPSDVGCKLLFYLHRVGRGVSISSICLLSVFQAIIISPRSSRWAEIKVKAPRYIGLSTSLCWLLYMLVNIVFPVFVTGNWRNDTIIKRKDFGYCSAKYHDRSADSLYAALFSFSDALCLGLMLWASGSMVSILYRHKQRVQHIHRTSLSPRSSPESRATQTILLLVSTFVLFYTFSTILHVCISVFDNPSWTLVNMAALFSACFSTVIPFVLMSQDSRVSRLSFSWVRNMKSLNIISNT